MRTTDGLAVLLGEVAHALADSVLAAGQVVLARLDLLGDLRAPVQRVGVAGRGRLGAHPGTCEGDGGGGDEGRL